MSIVQKMRSQLAETMKARDTVRAQLPALLDRAVDPGHRRRDVRSRRDQEDARSAQGSQIGRDDLHARRDRPSERMGSGVA